MPSKQATVTVDGASVIDLGLRLTGVPPVPPAELDPYLDAAARCFARFGISRTRVPDVAAELRVSRVTVYRQVGTVEDMARLLLARDLNRLLVILPAAIDDTAGPDTIVRLVVAIVDHARSHPVLSKVLNDEPHLLGPVLISDLGPVASRVADVVAPLLQTFMDSGRLARRDPRVIADWLVRQTVTLILAPPPGDLRAYVAELLVPALTPTKERR